MYAVTGQHGAAFPAETERLWATVAGNRRNVIPILDFLISRGLQEAAYSIASQQARAPPFPRLQALHACASMDHLNTLN
jgi:hypothetical protein